MLVPAWFAYFVRGSTAVRRARGGSRAFSKRSNPPRAPPAFSVRAGVGWSLVRARGGSRAFPKRSNPPRAPPSLFPCGSGWRKLSRLGALVRAPSEPSPAAPVRSFCLLTGRALRALHKEQPLRLPCAPSGRTCAAVGYRGARVLGARFVTPAGV